MKCAICKSKTFEGRCMCDIIENARNYIQPEAIDYEKTIREIGWDDDCIHSALNGFHHGFKTGHASRQQEVDELEVALGKTSICNQELRNEISTITKQLDEVTKVKERYEKALEFYASTDDKTDSFMRTNDDGITVWMCESDTEIVRDKSGAFLYYGKRAREALNGSSK